MKSEKILFKNREYYINSEDIDNGQNEKLFLFLDPALIYTAKDSSGKTLMVNIEDIVDNLKEGVGGSGAGYAVWGGGASSNYGNPGRGIGFGQGSNNGGPNLMYTYDIKPLNQLLQQPPTPQGDDHYIHNGVTIEGKVLGKNKKMEGQVISTKKNEEGDILYYTIMDPNSAEEIRIDPTSAEVKKEEIAKDLLMNRDIVESFYPSFDNYNKTKY
jgi:hypothetical protein